MKNIELMFHETKEEKVKRKKFHKKNCSINSVVLKELINYSISPIDIIDIKFTNVFFEDMLVIQLFENIVYYYMINNTKIDFDITLRKGKNDHFNNIFYITSFMNYIHKSYDKIPPFRKRKVKKRVDRKRYIEHYKKNQELKYSYRMFILNEELYDREAMNLNNRKLLHGIMEIGTADGLNTDYIRDIRELILELITNVKSHTINSDVVLQVNVIDVIKADTRKEHKFFAITLFSLSDNLLYEKTKKFYKYVERYPKLISDEKKEMYGKYMEIYKKHKEIFNDHYTDNHFFMLQSFQDGITSRFKTFGNSSGSGLANAIKVISNKIDDNEGFSYVYSGDKICYFKANSLNYKEGICTFNTECDYFKIPDKNIYYSSGVHFPGTAYQLIFPIKKEQAYEKNLHN